MEPKPATRITETGTAEAIRQIGYFGVLTLMVLVVFRIAFGAL